MENEHVKVPNFFYDIIVFITPTLSMMFGILAGLGFQANELIKYLSLIKVSGIDFILVFVGIFVILLFFAYEYGRLAEALSDWISILIKFLRKKKIFFTKEKDYSINFKNEILKLNLPLQLEDHKMDKWTIYFFALRFQPSLGSDLLKRYAWEKLSRSSSFTFGVLLCISLIMGIFRLFHIKHFFGYELINTGPFGFGSFAYNIADGILFSLLVYEYYRRKAWNNDLIVKILPVLTLPDNFNNQSSASNSQGR